MTSTRILALMDLMRDIEAPLKTYNAAVRKAQRTRSDSPENDAAISAGNAGLLEIEKTVRQWVAAHPDPEAAADGDEWVRCSRPHCPNVERRSKAAERGWESLGSQWFDPQCTAEWAASRRDYLTYRKP